MANKIPAAAASAEPRPKVKETIQSVLIPISAAASGLNARARMAIPIRVLSTMCRNATSSSRVTPSTMS